MQYVNWSPKARGSTLHAITNGLLGEAGEPDAFFTDPQCRQMFKNHMSVMVNRRYLLAPIKKDALDQISPFAKTLQCLHIKWQRFSYRSQKHTVYNRHFCSKDAFSVASSQRFCAGTL